MDGTEQHWLQLVRLPEQPVDDQSALCRLKAWRWPKNPGVTGAEVLTSPFFSVYATKAPGSMKRQ